ncbi:MAG TPA: hypothetical protein VMT67_13485 [Terriglobales bacterium]|nr:hypothetical protein [Terriglobales bacterium]
MSAHWAASVFIMLSLVCSAAAVHRQEKASDESAPAANPTAPPPTSKPDRSSTDTKTTPRPEKKRAKPKRVVASPQPPGTPKKKVVREGGVDEPSAQIVTGMSPEEAGRQRQESELLLSTTAEILKEIAPRELGTEQQKTVSQIHNYMTLSRDALKEGDIPRAHTLAQKANLLADDLRKH